MSLLSTEESGPASTPDASGEEDDSQVKKKLRSGKRDVPSSASSSPRGTPDSLRSGPLKLLHDVLRKGEFHFAGSDSSDSESSCGYPLFSALSRSPSIRSIPDTPLHPMYYANINPTKKRLRRHKLRPSSAQSISSRPEYSSRSTTVAGDTQQVAKVDDDDTLASCIPVRRPASAPNGLLTRRGSGKRSSQRVSFAPTYNNATQSHVQTQTCDMAIGKVQTLDKSTLPVSNSATQTLSDLDSDSGVQYRSRVTLQSRKVCQETKSIQTEVNFPRGLGHIRGKYLDVTVAAIAKRERYDKLRTSSARGPRTQRSSEKLTVQRCKSALAIMVTRNRVVEPQPMPQTSHTISTRRPMTGNFDSDLSFDDDYVETCSNISDSTSNFFGKRTIRRKYRSEVNHRMCNPPIHSRKQHQQSTKMTPSKLAKLKKAYGTKNFDLSGLAFYTKKLRLPMHGGYKCVSSREVDNIVQRLSSCRLSCGRMHDYTTRGTSVPTRRKRRDCHTAPSTRGSSRTNCDESKGPTGNSHRQKPQSKSKRMKGDRLNQEFGTVLTKSLDQIENSLSRARYVLSNLSGYVSSSPPECRRHMTSSLRTMSNGALVGQPFSMMGPTDDDADGKRNNFTIERKIREAWAMNQTASVSPEWIHITRKNCTRDIFNPPFLTAKQRTLPLLKQNRMITPSKANTLYETRSARKYLDRNKDTMFPTLYADPKT